MALSDTGWTSVSSVGLVLASPLCLEGLLAGEADVGRAALVGWVHSPIRQGDGNKQSKVHSENFACALLKFLWS